MLRRLNEEEQERKKMYTPLFFEIEQNFREKLLERLKTELKMYSFFKEDFQIEPKNAKQPHTERTIL